MIDCFLIIIAGYKIVNKIGLHNVIEITFHSKKLPFILKKLQKNKKVIRCVCCVKKEKEKRQQKGDKL